MKGLSALYRRAYQQNRKRAAAWPRVSHHHPACREKERARARGRAGSLPTAGPGCWLPTTFSSLNLSYLSFINMFASFPHREMQRYTSTRISDLCWSSKVGNLNLRLIYICVIIFTYNYTHIYINIYLCLGLISMLEMLWFVCNVEYLNHLNHLCPFKMC